MERLKKGRAAFATTAVATPLRRVPVVEIIFSSLRQISVKNWTYGGTEGAQLCNNDVGHKGEAARNNYRPPNLLTCIRSIK